MNSINSNITTEIMTILDLECIESNLLSDFDDFWTPSILKSELLNPNSKYIVAKDTNEIVGFGGIWKAVDEMHITNIVVKKTYRGRKIGGIILSELIKLSIKDNVKLITLEVNTKNIVAIKLYESYGFKKVGLRKKYYNNKEDAIIMTKEL